MAGDDGIHIGAAARPCQAARRMSHAPALIIHGHFYQPPRENPWTGEVSREPSAAPYHDWNERIHDECYRANGWARIIDAQGAVSDIVNNYSWMSFNVGPTLLRWLARRRGDTLRRIVAADRQSVSRLGHGNAIAQGYNHAILPLCNARDLRTQLRWGLREFELRYGRAAEALWLPETACNDAVMEALIDEGLRYVLLAPRQAASVKEGEQVRDVSDGSIDPRVPYRYVDRRDSGRSIAVFFYDGAISQAIAFEGLLSSSRALVERFAAASAGDGQLVHVVTDGETYGHHFKFGDRCVAYALSRQAARQGFWVTNYGALLDVHSPSQEVTLHLGDDGRGSSWSCVHGVGRWQRDCGCHTGGGPGYQQQWRAPLRAALDGLRDRAAHFYERACGELVDDPWGLRDEYIDALLAPPRARDEWVRRWAPRASSSAQRCQLLSLLESQRSSMLMYTSCGWFFNDLSGIETVQVMRYAGHLIDQLRDMGATPGEADFLAQLSEGRSNIASCGNGADIYRDKVAPARVSSVAVAAHIGLSCVATQMGPTGHLAGRHYRIEGLRQQRRGRLSVATMRIVLRHARTDRRQLLAACSIHLGNTDLSCVLKPLDEPAAFEPLADKVVCSFNSGASLLVLMRTIEQAFGSDDYDLRQLLPEHRQALSRALFAPMRERYAAQYELTFRDSEQTITRFREAGLPLPEELALAAQLALNERFKRAAASLSVEPFEVAAYERVLALVEQAGRYGFALSLEAAAQPLQRALLAALRRLVAGAVQARHGHRGGGLAAALEVLSVAERLGAKIDLEPAQELLFQALKEGHLPPDEVPQRLLERLALAPSWCDGCD